MALRRSPRADRSTGDAGPAHPGGADRGGAPADLVHAVVDEVSWYMTENKVSRADLALSMGVSPGRVSQILSGEENLTLRTLSGVLTALGADFELTLRQADDHFDGLDGEG